MSGGSPPGLGGGAGVFGGVGQEAVHYQEIFRGVKRFKDIQTHVEADAINVDKYLQESAKVCWDMFRATGAMFEQERLRCISMFIAAGSGGKGGGHRFTKGIMEHKVINNLRFVNGGTSLCRQWHQWFVTALGQYDRFTRRLSNTWSKRPTSART